MKLLINEALWLDLKNSIDYFQAESAQGLRFETDFYGTLERIQENPYLYQIINSHGHRRCIFKHYKYSIFYRVSEQREVIDILAVAGHSQKPNWMD